MRLLSLLLVLAGMATARAAAPAANALDRVLIAVAKSSEWKGARDQSDRLQALRKQALKYAAESDIASDRYQITALAGPVDLVRFFHLARTVCGGADRRTVLLQQWGKEKADRLTGPNPPADVELFPDDLPSNALGALFGDEVKPHNKDLGYDLIGALQKFFGTLDPVPDAVAAKIPFQQLVHGLPDNASADARRLSRAWVTAEPLYILPIVAPDKAKTLPNATAALKAANLEVRKHQEHAIVIERVGTPEPKIEPKAATAPATIAEAAPQKEPDTPIGHLFLRPSTATPEKFPKAVPVPEYPKAVPVRETPAKKNFPKAVPVKE